MQCLFNSEGPLVLTGNLRWETAGISLFLGPGPVLQNSGASDKNVGEML